MTRCEQAAFGATYPEHEVDDRLEHLEREVFSKVTTGESVQARLTKLETRMGIPAGAFAKSESQN